MGRKNKGAGGNLRDVAPRATKKPLAKVVSYALVFAFGAVLASALGLIMPRKGESRPPPIAPLAIRSQKPRSLELLLSMTPEQLAQVDIGEMNLLCAVGLPGAEDMDVDKCLATLDRWAQRVKTETERHLYRLTDPGYKEHAEHYKHSEARFRAEWLVSVLQQDVGVHFFEGFDPLAEVMPPFETAKQCFIHGVVQSDDAQKSFGGNCVSLPVVYAAVGRRLGYPVKLVCSKEHVFCRWEGLEHPNPAWRERFNFDGAGNGFSIDPDEFYLTWPRKTTAEEVKLYDWLQSMTPQQELALFLMNRGHVLRDAKRDNTSAQIAYAHAVRLWPTSRNPLYWLSHTVEQHWKVELAAHPGIYGTPAGELAGRNALLGKVPPRARPVRDPLAEVEMIDEINRRNMQRLMQPAGAPAAGMPQSPQPYAPHPGMPQPYRPPMPGRPPR